MTFNYVGHGYQIHQIDEWIQNEDMVYAFYYPHLPVKIIIRDDYSYLIPGEMPSITHEINFGLTMSDDLNDLVAAYNDYVQNEIKNLEERLAVAKQRFINSNATPL